MNEILLILAGVACFVMTCLWINLLYDVFRIWRGKD